MDLRGNLRLCKESLLVAAVETFHQPLFIPSNTVQKDAHLMEYTFRIQLKLGFFRVLLVNCGQLEYHGGCYLLVNHSSHLLHNGAHGADNLLSGHNLCSK